MSTQIYDSHLCEQRRSRSLIDAWINVRISEKLHDSDGYDPKGDTRSRAPASTGRPVLSF